MSARLRPGLLLLPRDPRSRRRRRVSCRPTGSRPIPRIRCQCDQMLEAGCRLLSRNLVAAAAAAAVVVTVLGPVLEPEQADLRGELWVGISFRPLNRGRQIA